MLRSVHATQGTIPPAEAALQRLTHNWEYVSAFEPARHQADIDTFLASVADPSALFPRSGKLDHSPAAELRARLPARHGQYEYFHLLIQAVYGSDLEKVSVIADKLLDELPHVRWSSRSASVFASYYDSVIRDDVGGWTHGVSEYRVLPALIQVATRLGPDAPFSKRLLAHVEQDIASRSEVLGYFAAGVEKVPPLIRNWTRAMSVAPHPRENGNTFSVARTSFAYHLTGHKPSTAELLEGLSTMHWSEIDDGLEVLHRDFGLPYTLSLALAVEGPLLAHHKLTDNRYPTRIATLGTIVANAERDGESGAREKLLAHIAKRYPLSENFDERSAHLGVVQLLVKNGLSTLTINDIDEVVAMHFEARVARSSAKLEQRRFVVGPLDYVASQIKLGNNTANQEGQPVRVLARSLQKVLGQHGFGGPDGFGRYLAERHSLDADMVVKLASPGGQLSELLAVVGSIGSYCLSDRGFESLGGTEKSFVDAFTGAHALRIARERTLGHRARVAVARVAAWFS